MPGGAVPVRPLFESGAAGAWAHGRRSRLITAPTVSGRTRVRAVAHDGFGRKPVVRRGGPSGSTTAELIRVKRHKFADAHSLAAGHALHTVRHPVIPARSVQLGHSQ